MPDFGEDTRGVSETLGYVLLFSIVILSITAVSIFGVNSLQEGRNAAVIENVEQSFEGMAASAQAFYRNNVSSRAVSLSTGPGQISVGKPVTIEVTVGGTTVVSKTTQPIVYSFEGSKIIYVGTAVLRVEEEGAVVVHRPDFRLDESAAIIPVLVLTTSGDDSVSGRATIQLTRQGETVDTTRGSSIDVTLTIDTRSTDRAEAWQQTLSEMLPSGGSCSVTSSTVDCTYTVSGATVLVQKVTVGYEFST